MKWHVHENDPDLIGGTVLVDGDRIREVFRLDTEEGWVDANCVAGADPDKSGTAAHRADCCPQPDTAPGERLAVGVRDEVCTRRFRGEVEVYDADEERVAT